MKLVKNNTKNKNVSIQFDFPRTIQYKQSISLTSYILYNINKYSINQYIKKCCSIEAYKNTDNTQKYS